MGRRPTGRADVARRTLWLACALLGLGGCTQKLDLTRPPVDNPPRDYVLVTPDSVQAIFSSRCPKCHTGTTPMAGLYLAPGSLSYRDLVNVPSTEAPTYLLVAPGDALNSYLMMKVNGDPRILESMMPLGDPALPLATRKVISNWIDQGARPDTVYLPALAQVVR